MGKVLAAQVWEPEFGLGIHAKARCGCVLLLGAGAGGSLGLARHPAQSKQRTLGSVQEALS